MGTTSLMPWASVSLPPTFQFTMWMLLLWRLRLHLLLPLSLLLLLLLCLLQCLPTTLVMSLPLRSSTPTCPTPRTTPTTPLPPLSSKQACCFRHPLCSGPCCPRCSCCPSSCTSGLCC